jgi:protein-S-isoprenylcysteine O-methyltransferase Ste14
MAERTRLQRIAKRIRVPMGFVVAAMFLVLAGPTARSLGLSMLLVVPGLWLRGYASGYLNKNSELATTGPYAYTRNPLYLGSLLITLGFGVASWSWFLTLVLVVLFGAIYWPTILGEEQYLRANFAGFEGYAARVPRLLPRLTAAAGDGAGEFSRGLYRKHREYNALMGAGAIYAALVLRLTLGNYVQLGRLLRDLHAYVGS